MDRTMTGESGSYLEMVHGVAVAMADSKQQEQLFIPSCCHASALCVDAGTERWRKKKGDLFT